MTDDASNQIGQHIPRMYRVALRVIADADKAHDVVQEACLKAVAKLATFNGQSTLVTWLHRITANCAKDAIRSEVRKGRARSLMQLQPIRPLTAPSAAEVAENRELSDLAWTLFEQLP